MSNMRAEGQSFIGCWCDAGFVAKIDKSKGALNRSQFAREALADKLKNLGILVEVAEYTSPDRKGKGGPRPASSSKIDQVGKKAVKHWVGKKKKNASP